MGLKNRPDPTPPDKARASCWRLDVHLLGLIPIYLIALLIAVGSAGVANAEDARSISAGAAALQSGQIGFVLLDPQTNQVLESQASGQSFIPASTVKLLTAWMALKVLGPAYRFETRLTTNGPIVDGTLHGDLCIVGTGDPRLVMDDIRALVANLGSLGIKRVEGRLLVDDGALPLLLRLDPTQPAQSPTNAGVGALSSEFNRVTVGWAQRGKGKGKTVSTWISPEADNLRATVVKPGILPRDAINPMVDSHGGTTFELAADRSTSGALAFPVADPGLQTGALFKTASREAGIQMPEPTRGTLVGGRVLVVHDSPPLSELVTDMLHYSNNQMAELLGLATAQRLAGQPSSLQAAAQVVSEALARDVPVFAGKSAFLANLSGLSARSRLTPLQLASLLEMAARQPEGNAFMAMLAEGGLSGTLRGRLKGPAMAGRVHAKTGTMAYVSALAGYAQTQSGRTLVFAIMCLDAGKRAAYDAAAGDRKPLDGPALRWIENAKAVQDSLVSRWIQAY
ncbi:D-alanyl-D-alanine carboxypeptidase / D-alanyl-D-alanine-endopeptidase (penicillin-binding protein 4) [Arboricoccus pini]|uniref:D-alanyl-D-alanine carboxypeptidase / D-alanyl-D-alanine-endopeptidase (Penicillin-binding protein 4) n=1 Tax=Arboricoccus pini TaxID=1963835 RepID=A0A212QPK8_9PROT|nr:D-alanyl-D-alanine carboxypeptidase / D-alanyl-D-alanine-endopeptidase (penicillin-binding protein 4) [Arboricoccus pini]